MNLDPVLSTFNLMVATGVPLPHAVSLASPPLLSFDIQEQLLLLQLPQPCGAQPPAQPSTLFLDQLGGLQDTHHPAIEILVIICNPCNILADEYCSIPVLFLFIFFAFPFWFTSTAFMHDQ